MALPLVDTVVTYPRGDTRSTSIVLHREPLGEGRQAVLLDVTAAHPVDSAWPDQGPDRGTLTVGEAILDLLDCVVGATDGSVLRIGADVPVKKGTEGWAFVVVHVVDAATPVEEGEEVLVAVDAVHREALSVGHTACHLASLALNAALAEDWSKQAATDALGHPDFDALAIATSTIEENGSVDRYRVGKSLRKKGFAPARLEGAADAVAGRVGETLAGWVASGASARIECDGDRLTDRRYWTTTLDGRPVSIACGGTHAPALSELGTTAVALELAAADGALAVTMRTIARLPA
ncbi:metal-dependent hydrolase [Herbiconiux liukaitaii]|uniref:metal-dependent hydrolase n=1 Tax=Herbiconiux liukaitaii TaxID=3342799 RepID=UPI0035BB8D14